LLPDSCDEKENALQDKKWGEEQSGPVNGAEEAPVIGQPHPYPKQRQNKANTLAGMFSL
jgi:hypothetical protein